MIATLNRHNPREIERFGSFTYEEPRKWGKAKLNTFGLKGDALEGSANLPAREITA